MRLAIDEMVHEGRWRVAELLRGRAYHSTNDLVLQYKSRVLSYLEYRTAAIYHAADTSLSPLDDVQRTFLRDLRLTDRDALEHFNLAPLTTHRDIAVLGMIHRAVLRKGPKQLQRLFPADDALDAARTRAQRRRHHRHLRDPRTTNDLCAFRRSAFGLVAVYNLLPARFVDLPNVSAFQGALQALVREAARQDTPRWPNALSPRLELTRHPLLTLTSST